MIWVVEGDGAAQAPLLFMLSEGEKHGRGQKHRSEDSIAKDIANYTSASNFYENSSGCSFIIHQLSNLCRQTIHPWQNDY
jgi:hypothetical protein